MKRIKQLYDENPDSKLLIASIAHEEAAMLACLDIVVRSGVTLSVNSAADFTRLATRLDKIQGAPEEVPCFRHRHSWSVFGGVFNNKGRPFVGYFQLCLEEGRF